MQTTEARHGSHHCAGCRLLLDSPWSVLFEGVVHAIQMVQLSNTTPILGIFVKSAIPGTHGTAGQCGCMQLW